MKILVTGGAGFIGSHIVEGLVEEGYTVRVLDDLSNGSIENLEGVIDRITFVRGDIRDESKLMDAVRGVDLVVHLAAKISVEESNRKPALYHEVNVYGTKLLLDAMIKNKTRAIIFTSSAAVYGDPLYLPIDEQHPLNPISYYGETKKEGEKLDLEYMDKYGVKGVIIRLFNVYGSRQRNNEYAGVIRKFVERLIRGEPPIICGDGQNTRDFIYVRDVVRAFLFIINKLN